MKTFPSTDANTAAASPSARSLSRRRLLTAGLALLPLGMFARQARAAAQNEPVPKSDTSQPPPPHDNLPTLFLIGDSTVNTRDNLRLGWGFPLMDLFDQSRIHVQNRARGGTSSRSFVELGLWDKVLADMKPGDYLLIQFGHNDSGKIDEPTRHRATLKGIGDETRTYPDTETGKPHLVHTYGWYLTEYVRQAKAKGVLPIVLSPIPRNLWKDGKVGRNNVNDYGMWAKQVAEKEGVPFIDLNAIIADKYDVLGQEKVGATLFPATDHTHTTPAGATFNAKCVAEGIRGLKDVKLKEYLLPASAQAFSAAP